MKSWDEYVKEGIVRKSSVNLGVIKSLIKDSDDLIGIFSKLNIEDENVKILFKNYYDALRGICESICLLNGYKIYNHEAVGLFFREILKEDLIFIKFDRLRIIRNGIHYYGKGLDIGEGKASIEEIKKLIVDLKERYLKMI